MKHLIAAIIITLTPVLQYTQTDKNPVELKYIRTIINGEDQNKKEYLYKNPAEARFDKDNNIYIIEYHGSEIKKYSKEGKYIKTIGRAGNGPGELYQISSLDIYGEHIIVRGAAERMIEYSTNGNVLKTSLFNCAFLNFQQLWYYDNTKYLVRSFNRNKISDNIFYICDAKLKNIFTSFCHPGILFDLNSPALSFESLFVNTLILNNGDVLAAKTFYDGKIYWFNSKQRWQHDVLQSGIKYAGNRILAPYNQKERYNNLMAMSDDKYKVVAILLRTVSAGLVLYDNKYILNFVVKCTNWNEESEFGVEIYNMQHKCLGYYKINNSDVKTINMRTKVYGIDKENMILLFDQSNGLPQIKKFRLKVDL